MHSNPIVPFHLHLLLLHVVKKTAVMSSAVPHEESRPPPPLTTSFTPLAAARAALAPTTATVAASEDILRGIYNEKLHASVRSIITTLTTELPEDHIFLQLLADPSTQQYCRVRLAEVVEGFLYSTQAEQYHELAKELVRREQDSEAQRQRIEELEAALGQALHDAQQQRQQMMDEISSHTSRSPPIPSSHVSSPEAAAGPSSAPARSSNPMEDEEARRELLRALEQATHDQELHRCRQALQAVARVVAVTSDEMTYDDKYLYEGELMTELYKCVQSLLQYVDGALDSQERLRREIQEQHSWVVWKPETESRGSSALPTTALNGSANHEGEGSGGGGGGLVSSDFTTPQRPRVMLGSINGSVFSSTVSSHLSSASAPRPPRRPPLFQSNNNNNSNTKNTSARVSIDGQHGIDEIQQRRDELQQLAQQLRSGQLRSRQVLETLAAGAAQHRREVAQLQRAVAAARDEATAAAATAENVQHAKENMERLRAETAATAAAERTELRDKLADAQAQHATAALDLQAARRELQQLKTCVSEKEEQETAMLGELAAMRAALHKVEAQLREQQKERTACQAQLVQCKAAHQADVDALLDAARELLCLRVEKTMAGLTALFQEAKAAKAELLEREGYQHLCSEYSTAAAAQHAAARHAQMQLQVAETAELETAMTQQSVADALGALLRSLWADDATEGTLGGNSAEYDVSLGTGDGPSTAPTGVEAEVGTKEGSAASADASRAQKYRLPTTLEGLCAALKCAYASVRARHHARQKAVDSLRTTLIGKDIELRAAQANEAQLRDQLRAERAKEEQWRAEMTQLSEHNPMRDLLARQDALLKAVSEERNALRRQWNSLSGDYIALEQRNGVLHARCAEKEHENARLSGMLLRSATSNRSTPSRPAAAAAALSQLPVKKSVLESATTAAARTHATSDQQNSAHRNRLSSPANASSTSGSFAVIDGNEETADEEGNV